MDFRFRSRYGIKLAGLSVIAHLGITTNLNTE